jgi:hypothetical protein
MERSVSPFSSFTSLSPYFPFPPKRGQLFPLFMIFASAPKAASALLALGPPASAESRTFLSEPVAGQFTVG